MQRTNGSCLVTNTTSTVFKGEKVESIFDEFDTLNINGEQYNRAKRPTLTPKQVQALKSDNILKILQATI